MKKLLFIGFLTFFLFLACDDSNNDDDGDNNPETPEALDGFLALYSDGGGSETLHYLDPETGENIELYSNWVTGASWDGFHAQIAFSNNYDIFTIDPTDLTTLTRHTTTDSTIQEKNPAFLDGDSILVFTVHNGFYFDGVALMDMETGIIDTIRDLGYQIQNLEVSPSYSFIGYQRRTVQQGVYVMNREGSNQFLSSISNDHNNFNWSGTEDKFAITSDEWIKVPDLIDESTFELISSEEYNFVAYSPQGDKIAFTVEYSGYSNLKIVDSDGSNERTIIDNSSSNKTIKGISFSENGEKIAIALRGEDWLYDIDVVQVSNASRVNIVSGVGSFTKLKWF